MNRHHLICTLIVFLTALTSGGCRPNHPQSQISLLSSSGFLKDWEAPLGLRNDPVKALYVRGGTVIAYSESNHGYFIAANSGAVLGFDRIRAEGFELIAPVETASFIAIPTSSTIELFDKSGRRLNSFAMPFAVLTPATSIGDSLFLGISHGADARLGRFELSAERIRAGWELYTTDRLQSAPTSLNDAVYIAGTDGKVWAVSSGRAALWNTPANVFRTDAGITADLVADEFALYVPSQDKKLYALDRATGRIKWSYYAGLPLLEPPVTFGNNVYQQVPDRGLVALDKTEGKFAREPLWVQPQAEQVLSADERYIYVRSGKSIVALDRATGSPAFHTTRTDLVAFATNTQSPTIYAATRGGAVLAIRPVTRPGSVGEIVFDSTLLNQPLAAAE